MFSNQWKSVLGAAALASVLVFPAMARIGMPVSLTLASADALKRGEPALVHVVIRPGADLPLVSFQALPSDDWQIVEGSQYWSGSLRKGEDIELRLRVVPLKDDPTPLRATLRTTGFPDLQASLDPERMGGRFPEKIDLGVDRKQGRMTSIDPQPEDIQVNFEPGVELPEPAAATEPRVPGQRAEQVLGVEAGSKSKSRGAVVVATATGRFVFIDDANAQRGLRFATVELWNQNPAPSFGDALCARGVTDGSGNFSISGPCGDSFDGPDLFVRLVLNNSIVEVKPNGIFTGSYVAQSGVLANRPAGVTAFGTITIPNVLAGPFQLHNLITRAERLMRDAGETMPKVNVKFPADATFYSPAFDEVHIPAGTPFGQEGDVFHEYGHHVLDLKAESPAPNYDNGICDDPTPGHCIFQPENQTIAWTEGWPNFFAQVLHNAHNTTDGYGTTRYRFDANTGLTNFAFPGLQDQTEGFIAAILIDLFDAVEANPSHADTLSLSFNTLWSVVKGFDPSTDLFHNHPTNIHEYWNGLRVLQNGNINRISAIYASLGIIKPRPNLEIIALQDPPTQVSYGTEFTVTNRVMNTGNERANSASTVRFRFVPVVPTTRGLPFTVGSRSVVAGLVAGGLSSATTRLTVPTGVALGWYILEACADRGNAVPESDEGDNCTTAGGVEVQ